MQHEPIDDYIYEVMKSSPEQLQAIKQRVREFKAQAQAQEVARPQAQFGPWPGQQQAIDAAFESCSHAWLTAESLSSTWNHEAPARLAIAQAYDAARPQAAEITALKAALAESEKQFQDKVYEIGRLLDECDKAQGILKACLSVMPFGNLETHTVENLPHRIAELAAEIASLSLENERLDAKLTEIVEAAEKAGWNGVENSKHLPTYIADFAEDLSKAQAELAAAKGEGQTMTKNVPGDKCPACGAEEVEANTPRTTYACGSSDYDGRPGTFHPGDKCEAKPVVVNEPPKSEGQPDLSGESEKQEGAATKEAPATFEAHGYTWTRHTPGDPMPCDGGRKVYWLLESEFKGKILYSAITAPARALFWTDVVGWRYADEPAQAKAEPARPWTPAVGDTVRLKSGGPVMTVHYIAKDGNTGCVHNANGHFEFTTVPAACLTPAQP